MTTMAAAPIIAPSNWWEPLSSHSSSFSSPSTPAPPSSNNSSNTISAYSTGRSRSNTLTAVLNAPPSNSIKPDDLSAALGNFSINGGGVRPRRASIVHRECSSSFSTTVNSVTTPVASPSSDIKTSSHQITNSTLNNHVNNTSGRSIPIPNVYLQYPPPPPPSGTALMPSTVEYDLESSSKEDLYHHVGNDNNDNEPLLASSDPSIMTLPKATTVTTTTAAAASTISATSSGWNFLLRVLTLAGLFISSLGGLYLMAMLLPPLSLPKSIDDVKEDAAILTQFATADYDGWLRTFWVFSAVYIWKQSFGIPGSAFLNILAGALYGPWFGTLLTSFLTTAGSVVAYFISWFLMEPILERFASTRLDQMRLMIQEKANAGKKKSEWKLNKSRRSSTSSDAAEDKESLLPTWRNPVEITEATINNSNNGNSSNNNNVATGMSLDVEPTVTLSSSLKRTNPLASPLLRTRSSSFTSRQTVVHFRPGSPVTTVAAAAAAAATEATVGSPVAVVARQEDSLEFEIQPAADGGFDFSSPVVYETDAYIEKKTSQVINDSDVSDNDNEEDDDDDGEEEQGTSLFMQLLWIRLFPLTPYWFINLASPLIGVPLWPFMTSMFIGVTPYNYLCAQAGAILGEIHELRDIYQQPRILVQIILVVILMSATVWATKHFSKKQLQQTAKQQQQRQKKNRKGRKSRYSDETDAELLPHDREARQQLLNSDGSEVLFDYSNDRDDHVELSALRAQYQRRPSAKHDSTVVHMNF